MYNICRPDILVHPLYMKTAENFLCNDGIALTDFNIVKLDELTIDLTFEPHLITDTASYPLQNVQLEATYTNQLQKLSGIRPEYTSYQFSDGTPLYRINERGPRYVIWTKEDPLTVCATHVDRIDEQEVYAACMRAKSWANQDLLCAKSVIVFDLDETLINQHGKKYKNADQMLALARNKYDLVVLYSHGSNLHVDQYVQQFLNTYEMQQQDEQNNYTQKFTTRQQQQLQFCSPITTQPYETPLFDLILSKNPNGQRANKNLLTLYNYFPNIRFDKAILVDDSLFNWTPEYTDFLIPQIKTDLYYAMQHI
jgi:hypothetical protein